MATSPKGDPRACGKPRMVPDVLGEVGTGAIPDVLPMHHGGGVSETPETDRFQVGIAKNGMVYRIPRGQAEWAGHAARLARERDEARLSLKHAMEAECIECGSYKQDRDRWRACAEGLAADLRYFVRLGANPDALAEFDRLKEADK